MGYSKSLYIGPTIRLLSSIKIPKKKQVYHCSNKKCSEYKQSYNISKFCKECGSSMVKDIIIENNNLTWFGFCDLFDNPEKYENFLYSPETFDPDISLILICNEGDYGENYNEEVVIPINIKKLDKKLQDFKKNILTKDIITMLDKIAPNQYVIENNIVYYIS